MQSFSNGSSQLLSRFIVSFPVYKRYSFTYIFLNSILLNLLQHTCRGRVCKTTRGPNAFIADPIAYSATALHAKLYESRNSANVFKISKSFGFFVFPVICKVYNLYNTNGLPSSLNHFFKKKIIT